MFDTGCVGTRKREYVPKHYAADGVRRHVWIYGKDPTARYPWPGLLVEWHRREDEWWARVLFVPYPSVPGEFVSEWIPASALRVAQEPYPPDRLPPAV